MTNLKLEPDITGLLVIDPYNDFISEGGKVWDRIKAVAEANQCIPHMSQVLEAVRKADIRVFYALHRRYRAGDYETWKYISPVQKAAWSSKVFGYGTWGGEIRREFQPQAGDIVALEHWGSSGFANTDLDLQLKKHGIHKLIVVAARTPFVSYLKDSLASLRNQAGTSIASNLRLVEGDYAYLLRTAETADNSYATPL